MPYKVHALKTLREVRVDWALRRRPLPYRSYDATVGAAPDRRGRLG
jgi:hypothetical protein